MLPLRDVVVTGLSRPKDWYPDVGFRTVHRSVVRSLYVGFLVNLGKPVKIPTRDLMRRVGSIRFFFNDQGPLLVLTGG